MESLDSSKEDIKLNTNAENNETTHQVNLDIPNSSEGIIDAKQNLSEDKANDQLKDSNAVASEEKTNGKTKLSKKKMILLYIVLIVSILISSTTGILAKFASGEPFLSFKFCLLYGSEIIILFVYAIIWQQIIKHLNLSVAYSFKATALIWTLVWGSLVFKENFGITNFIGVAVVIVGIIIVNLKK